MKLDFAKLDPLHAKWNVNESVYLRKKHKIVMTSITIAETAEPQKQPFADVFQNRCSEHFCNGHRKTPLLKSLLQSCLKACNFIEKRLQHRCFPVKKPPVASFGAWSIGYAEVKDSFTDNLWFVSMKSLNMIFYLINSKLKNQKKPKSW